jgi:hypothetical protein
VFVLVFVRASCKKRASNDIFSASPVFWFSIDSQSRRINWTIFLSSINRWY